MDVVSVIKGSRMGPRQYLVIFLCFLCTVVDGYDLTVVGFALPRMPHDFVSTVERGWLISIGLIGMGVGAAAVAPFADRFGRRRLIIFCLALNCVAMITSAIAPNIEFMFVTRFFTGVAVGGVSALAIVMAQEYSSLSQRNMSVALTTIGFAVGGAGGGVVGLSIVEAFGGSWRVLFWVGAVVSGLVVAVSAALMPESLAYLMVQRTEGARRRIAAIADRMRLKGVDPSAQPPVDEVESEIGEKVALLGPRYRRSSLLLWVGYTCITAAYYFVGTWTPQLISDYSDSAQTGTMVGTIISFGAVAGAIVFGVVGIKFLATKIAWVCMVIAVIAQVAFAVTLSGGVAIVSAAILGLTSYAAITAYAAAGPPLFPIQARARAIGLMYGFSRVGAIAAPLATGYLLSYLDASSLYLAASVLFGVGALSGVVLWLTTRNYFEKERDSVGAERTSPEVPGVPEAAC